MSAEHPKSQPAGDASEAAGPEPDYRAFFDALPAPVVVIAPPDFVMVAANEARLRVTSTRREDVIGRRLFDVFPDNPEDPQATGVANLRASLARVLATRRTDVMAVQKYDIRGPAGDFEERWWTPVNTPVLGPDGEVRYILHQVEDVTAEMRERRRAAEAEASAARFREVADAIPGLVFETDLQARNTYVNEPFVAYTGLSYEALMGDGWRKVIHPADLDRTAAELLASLRTAQPFEGEVRMRSAAGDWRWFLVRAIPLRGPHGWTERSIGICTDIDDAKRGEAALRDLHELQHTMLQEVGHRVKNSLALVASVLDLEARSVQGEARHALEEASLRVHAVAAVHDQLWRRAETEDIDLKPFLSALCEVAAKASPRHATRCEVESAVVAADMAVPLGLVVNELLTNAYKYAYPQGEEGEVWLLGRREADARYRISVNDFGRGLPADFDLNKPRKSLGLRVITGLAKQLKGQLHAQPGERGARFTLVFPLDAAQRGQRRKSA
jgi:PAS domain S-box-containing protein